MLLDLASAEEGKRVLDRLLAATAAPVEVEGRCLQVSASLGVACYDSADGGDADLLLRYADQAMYQAKEAGKHCYRVHEAKHRHLGRSVTK